MVKGSKTQLKKALRRARRTAKTEIAVLHKLASNGVVEAQMYLEKRLLVLKYKSTRSTAGKAFYKSNVWKRLRYNALVASDGRCLSCGASARDGVKLRVDHIKSIGTHPELMAEPSNVQVLCNDCNWGKGGLDDTDWRYTETNPYPSHGQAHDWRQHWPTRRKQD